jgi:RNA polymerase sigma-70 factor, ECF subfamily
MTLRGSITSLDRETEIALVAKAKAGDFDAFDQLVRSCERRIWAISWRLLGDKEETENAVQTAFLKAMEALDSFRGEAGFCTWMGRIATNESLEILRRRKRDGLSLDSLGIDADDDGPVPHPELLVDWREDPSRSVEREEMRAILDQALDTLTPGLRAVFVLRDMEGLSTLETAEQLGISESNAKVRLLRARLTLRERLTEAFGGEALVHSHLDHGGLGGLAAAMEARP